MDIEVLGQDGEADPAVPRLTGVPLPLPSGGEEMGMFAFPQEGTQVVVCFAYGSPSKPYIQTILPHGLSLPKVPNGDQVWQHSDAVQQRVDADGNWLRLTDGKIRDHSLEREVETLGNSEKYQSHVQEVENHSTEEVGASSESTPWARSNSTQPAPPRSPLSTICTKRPGATSTWWWARPTTQRLVATCRKRSRACAVAWWG